MASNYDSICEDNRGRYGSEGAQKSGGLAASLYDNKTHFIFELLQNAEDALSRRGDWHGPRKIAFDLTHYHLTLSHFGKPFDEADVRSVCDIAESTKNETSIGRFGLGFKSVYTVTDSPEIHSGDEDFSIENYVFPQQADRAARDADETKIILPLRSTDKNVPQEITTGLRHLGPGALLFLRNIEEISWNAAGNLSGFYLRNSPEVLGQNVHRITVIGQESGQPEVDQNWLIFHREVFSAEQKKVGRVEIAFSLVMEKNSTSRWTVQPLPSSPLVVFFPTVVESHLGFLVQGPYRTTPSRDNIPPGDPWNQHLVTETASLLIEAMRWMRDSVLLDIATLRCLPLEREKFPLDSRFAPMFDAVQQAFQEEALLPTFDGRFVKADQAKLARTQELRELFTPGQVATLFDLEAADWLSGDITQDRAPEIIKYLTQELNIELITPTKLVQSLTKPFLEAQPDGWVLRLYEFLTGQEAALRRSLDTIPLIRLEDGTHVIAHKNGEAKAFLPGVITTGFPTVRRAVCATSGALAFLSALKITEPDPVDDVVRHILPKYHQKNEVNVNDATYTADIERIRSAFNTDSTAQKEKLRLALRNTTFVMAVDTGDGKFYVAKPGNVYIATDRLKQLFAGVPHVLMVDDNYDCLRGEEIRELLVACGASRYLAPQAISSRLTDEERLEIRKEAGLVRASWQAPPDDFTIRGLTQLLEVLPKLGADDAKARAELLWDSLIDLEGRGVASFNGSYRWGYSQDTKTARFDADFVRVLAQVAWVYSNGQLQPPSLVLFDSLGWKSNSFLLTKIVFKPPLIDQLAKEAGIDPAVLDLLRRDPKVVAELLSRLNTVASSAQADSSADNEANPEQFKGDVYDGANDLYGDDMPDIPTGTHDPDAGDDPRRKESGSGQSNGGAHSGSGSWRQGSKSGVGHRNRAPGQSGTRPFISYVGTHPDDDGRDPDGLDQVKRMQIEEIAITLIISLEPKLRRTSEGNPGFDLYETDDDGKQVRWVEVKSMTGSLDNRPVGLSQKQFNYAREKGSAYWLYIVEHANDPMKNRILRIQAPYSLARTFTFDKGWSQIASTELP